MDPEATVCFTATMVFQGQGWVNGFFVGGIRMLDFRYMILVSFCPSQHVFDQHFPYCFFISPYSPVRKPFWSFPLDICARDVVSDPVDESHDGHLASHFLLFLRFVWIKIIVIICQQIYTYIYIYI